MAYQIISETNFDKARRQILDINKINQEIIFCSHDDELSRKILEKSKIGILLINVSDEKDKLKQRGSGLNQVLAKLAKKQNVKIGINVDEIFQSRNMREKSDILARIKQNIKLCNKNKIQIVFVSPSERKMNEKDFQSLGIILGMPTWMIKSCVL